jgi:hypothetical protein
MWKQNNQANIFKLIIEKSPNLVWIFNEDIQGELLRITISKWLFYGKHN